MIFDFSITEQPAYVIITLRGELIEKNQANDLLAKIDELLLTNKNKLFGGQ